MDNLTIFKKGLVPLYVDSNGNYVVNARHLHGYLGIGKDFSTWVKDKIKRYSFAENVDYSVYEEEQYPIGSKHKIEYMMTIHTAKAICFKTKSRLGPDVLKYLNSLDNIVTVVREPQRDEILFKEMIEQIFEDTYLFIPQYQVLDYKIDFYFPELELAIEYDEEHHNSIAKQSADQVRQAAIEKQLSCRFIRVAKGQELKGINEIIKEIARMV